MLGQYPQSFTLQTKGSLLYLLRIPNTTYNPSGILTMWCYPLSYPSKHHYFIIITQCLICDLHHHGYSIIHLSCICRSLILWTIYKSPNSEKRYINVDSSNHQRGNSLTYLTKHILWILPLKLTLVRDVELIHQDITIYVGRSHHPPKSIILEVSFKLRQLIHPQGSYFCLQIQHSDYLTNSKMRQPSVKYLLHVEVTPSFNDTHQISCQSKCGVLSVYKFGINLLLAPCFTSALLCSTRFCFSIITMIVHRLLCMRQENQCILSSKPLRWQLIRILGNCFLPVIFRRCFPFVCNFYE